MMICLKYISLFPPSCTVCKTWSCKNLPAAVFCKLLDRGRLSDRVVLQEDQIVSEKYCVFFAWRGREVKEPFPPPRFVTYCCAPLIFWYLKLRVDHHFFFSCFLNPLWIINSRIFCAPNQQRLKSLRILEGGREFGIKHCEVYIWIRRLEIGKEFIPFSRRISTQMTLWPFQICI